MARARAAAVVPLAPREAKAAAVARVIARPRPAKFATYADPHSEGRVRIQLEGGPGEFAEPQTVAEWCDDRQARTPVGEPVADALFEAWEICRGGPSATPQAVSYLADKIRDPHQRFALFMAINSAPAGPAGIGTALAREWTKRKLPVAPQPMMPREPMNRNSPSEASKRVVYRSELGHPAGLTA